MEISIGPVFLFVRAGRKRNMAWIEVCIAGLFEVVWAVAMKSSEGFTRLVPSVVTICGLVVSFVFLALATKRLPLGTAYAVWTGIGTVGTVIAGDLLFQESIGPIRFVFLAMIVAGIVGLKLA